MGHGAHSHPKTSTIRVDRKVRHLIQPEYRSDTQSAVEQPFSYPGHPATASGIPGTQGPHPGHPSLVGGGRASEAVEIFDQVSVVAVTSSCLKLTKYIGPEADSSER